MIGRNLAHVANTSKSIQTNGRLEIDERRNEDAKQSYSKNQGNEQVSERSKNEAMDREEKKEEEKRTKRRQMTIVGRCHGRNERPSWIFKQIYETAQGCTYEYGEKKKEKKKKEKDKRRKSEENPVNQTKVRCETTICKRKKKKINTRTMLGERQRGRGNLIDGWAGRTINRGDGMAVWKDARRNYMTMQQPFAPSGCSKAMTSFCPAFFAAS
jgi:hypothetical protein